MASVGSDEPDLDAGPFGVWLDAVRAAIRGERASEVPCDGCTACCRSGQFVHIGPDEVDTLARVPVALRVPAPGLPAGHVVLGYDEQGRCPMLVGDRCSIYEDRPRACRTYDCRVLAAAGLDPAVEGKPAIAGRVRRWRFAHPGPDDEVRHEAVRRAARYLQDHPEVAAPPTVTQLAVAAIEASEAFVGPAEPDPEAVRVQLQGRSGRPREKSRDSAKGPGSVGR